MIREFKEITPSTVGVVAADGNGATWTADIWKLTVPFNQKYIVGPDSIFGCYLKGDDGVEMPAATLVRVVKRDMDEIETKVLWSGLYGQIKDLTDKNSYAKLQRREEVEITPGEHLAVMVNGADVAGTGDTLASTSHFKLTSFRERKPLQ